jgi:hypothetical protein
VTNWPEYDTALIRRRQLTVWFTDEAVAAWHAPATGRRGDQPIYSDLAIETGLALPRSRSCSAFGSESPTIRRGSVANFLDRHATSRDANGFIPPATHFARRQQLAFPDHMHEFDAGKRHRG